MVVSMVGGYVVLVRFALVGGEYSTKTRPQTSNITWTSACIPASLYARMSIDKFT